MVSLSDDEEVGRARKLMEALIRAEGLTDHALDERLGRGAGYVSQVLGEQQDLKYRQILELLGAVGLEPGLFFRALFLEPERPRQSGAMMDRFLDSLERLGFQGTKLAPPPLAPQLEPAELDRRIRNAIQEALGGRGAEAPAELKPG